MEEDVEELYVEEEVGGPGVVHVDVEIEVVDPGVVSVTSLKHALMDIWKVISCLLFGFLYMSTITSTASGMSGKLTVFFGDSF